MKPEGVPGLRRDLRPLVEPVRDEPEVRLPPFRLSREAPPRGGRRLERVGLVAGVRDREREMEDGLALRFADHGVEEDDGLGTGLHEDRLVLHCNLGTVPNGLPAPASGAEPLPEMRRVADRVIHGGDRGREAGRHHVSDRYRARVFSAIRSHVN